MKRFTIFLVLLVFIAGFAIASGDGERTSAQGRGSQGGGIGRGSEQAAQRGAGYGQSGDVRFADSLIDMIAELEISDLTNEEAAGLTFMFEEEKLARDVYSALYEVWNYPIFANISSSEQQHMDVLGELMDRYELTLPVTTEVAGEFTSEILQTLYDDLLSAGKESLVSALTVGATVEDLDIADLLDYIVETDSDDLAIVYQNLLKGSRNHLRSFTSQLERQDVTYSATYMTDDYMAKVLSTDRESVTITEPDFMF